MSYILSNSINCIHSQSDAYMHLNDHSILLNCKFDRVVWALNNWWFLTWIFCGWSVGTDLWIVDEFSWGVSVSMDALHCSLISSHQNTYIRRIYIANFAIFKIATFWSYHLHLREKSRSFSFMKRHDFLVGSAHVRSQATKAATVHAFMHAAHAVCMRAEDIDTRFKERA